MTQRIISLGLSGIHGFAVQVECFLGGGLFNFDIVGLPDAAVKESRERVRAAIKTAGYDFPLGRITVNLAPAGTRKSGTVYDLPVLLGILAANGLIKEPPSDTAYIGELSLSGEVRPVPGALPMALGAVREGIKKLCLPAENAAEAAYASELEVYPVRNVTELISHLRGETVIERTICGGYSEPEQGGPDFSDVKGQENIKRALEIAVAGNHNMLMSGPPGSGKSMLASRIPSIFPAMSPSESLEVTQIHSIAGLTGGKNPVVTQRPFRAPHHTTSQAGLTGGSSALRPGEISLAHNGVLFLDELPEFANTVLETLRQPLEDGSVTITRVSGTVTYPSRFMLICAMNPCKCGWHGSKTHPCRCSEHSVRNYRNRISGPLLDRIDIFANVRPLSFKELRSIPDCEPSSAVRERVNEARLRQRTRFPENETLTNAYMNPKQIAAHCALDSGGEALLKSAFEKLGLTARSHDKILRVARTIADLDGSSSVRTEHLTEALQFRVFDPHMERDN